MEEKRIPILTGKNFQILEAKHRGDIWTITARLGGKVRKIEVQGNEEQVLQVIETLSKKIPKTDSLKNRISFSISDGKIADTEIPVEEINPFVTHLFKKHIED